MNRQSTLWKSSKMAKIFSFGKSMAVLLFVPFWLSCASGKTETTSFTDRTIDTNVATDVTQIASYRPDSDEQIIVEQVGSGDENATRSIIAREIIVTEMGLANHSLPVAQARELSRQAAIVQAERALLRKVQTYIESEIVVDRGMVQRDIIMENVSGVLRGAEVIDVRYNDPYTCYVTMSIRQETMQQLVNQL